MEPTSRAQEIVVAMGHPDPRRRIQAIKAAASCRAAGLADAALQALKVEMIPQLRLGFVQLLGLVGSVEHGEALRAYLSDPVAPLRYRCFEALARIADPSLMDALVYGVSDEEKKVRKFCVDELLKLEGSTFPDLLARMVASPEPEAREAAVTCAGKFLSGAMVKVLASVADDDGQDEALRSRARAGIQNFAEKGNKRAQKWLKRHAAGSPSASGGTVGEGAEARPPSEARRLRVDLEPVRLGPIRSEGRSGRGQEDEEPEGASPVALTPSKARPNDGRRSRPSSKALRPVLPRSRALVPACPSGVRGVAHWDFFVGGMNMLIAAVAMMSGQGLFMVMALFFGAIGAFHLWMGRALKEGRPWARTANIVFAILQLPSIPVGTLIGILILHTLYSDEGKIYFGK